MTLRCLDDAHAVRPVPFQAGPFLCDDDVDQPSLDVGEQALEGGALRARAGDVVVLVDPCWGSSSSLDECLGVLSVAVHTQAAVLAILRDPQVDGGPSRLSAHGVSLRQRLFGYGTWWSFGLTSVVVLSADRGPNIHGARLCRRASAGTL